MLNWPDPERAWKMLSAKWGVQIAGMILGARSSPCGIFKFRTCILAGTYGNRTHPGRPAPHTGFEDQEIHRHLSAPKESIAQNDWIYKGDAIFY